MSCAHGGGCDGGGDMISEAVVSDVWWWLVMWMYSAMKVAGASAWGNVPYGGGAGHGVSQFGCCYLSPLSQPSPPKITSSNLFVSIKLMFRVLLLTRHRAITNLKRLQNNDKASSQRDNQSSISFIYLSKLSIVKSLNLFFCLPWLVSRILA